MARHNDGVERIRTELPGIHDRHDINVSPEVRAAFEAAVTEKKTKDGWCQTDIDAALVRNGYGGYKSVYYEGAWWAWRHTNVLPPVVVENLDDLI